MSRGSRPLTLRDLPQAALMIALGAGIGTGLLVMILIWRLMPLLLPLFLLQLLFEGALIGAWHGILAFIRRLCGLPKPRPRADHPPAPQPWLVDYGFYIGVAIALFAGWYRRGFSTEWII